MRNLALQVLFGTLVMARVPPLAYEQVPADPASEIASALRAHQYQQAVKLARSALERSPNDVRILTMEAIALSALDDDHDALAAYNRALRLAPDYLAALEGAAQIEYKSGSERAIALLERLLKLRPNEPTAHAMRAVLAWKQGDCETAVRHFGLAGNAISSQAAALQEYGACLARLQRPAQAIPVFRQLTTLDPGDRRVRYRLAAAQFMAKAYGDAISTLGPLMEGKDADPNALDLASAAWEALGDTPRAVAALREAIVLAPTDTRFYVDFASLCLVHKSFEVGIDMINAGLSRAPNAAPLYLARGVLNVQLAQYDQADADFAAAERLDPRQAYGSLARGLSQVQQNDFDKALATVREQLKTRQKDEFLYYLLAEILTSQGAQVGSPEFQEAVAAASRAVQLKPDFVLARDVLSRLYLESGQTDRAIEQCRLALRDSPSDTTALYRLIRALQRSGKASDAEEIPALLKRFNEVRQQLRQQEAEEARYKLVEAGSPESDKSRSRR
ncbi:MAG: tetratricopeptide repeat protein [Bryobacteraceae bacterium]|jgi:tetratricopeptide (TPR) repeat protein